MFLATLTWGKPLREEQEIESQVLSWVSQAGSEGRRGGEGGSGQSGMGRDSWRRCNKNMVSFSPRSGKLSVWSIALPSGLERRKLNREQRCKIEEKQAAERKTLHYGFRCSQQCSRWLQGAVCWRLGPKAVPAAHASSPVLLINRELKWHGGAQVGCSALAEPGWPRWDTSALGPDLF